MEQAARTMGAVQPIDAARSRAPVAITLEVSDPDVVAELRRYEGGERDRYALAALRVGVHALRAAAGQIDAATVREAGAAVVADVRELLTARATEMSERLKSLVKKDGDLERVLRAHVAGDDSLLAKTLDDSLAEQRESILREFSLDDDASALARLKRQLLLVIDGLAKSNGEFQSQVREAVARIETRKKEHARSTRHGIAFEEALGAWLASEAQRLGDLHEATGDCTGQIKNCKVGDHVVELGADSAAAHARIVWEAKEQEGYALREACSEIDEARRNRRAQIGVFVFSARTAPEGIEPLARHGSDVVVAWDAEDESSDVVLRAAYSLARALVVRERRNDDEAKAVVIEIDRATRAVERQAAHLDDVRRLAETVRGNGDKIVKRAELMAADLRREVDRLDAQVAALRESTDEVR